MAGHKYLPNGKIQIVITHGSDIHGKPKRYWKTIEKCSKKQLEIEDALFLAEIMSRSASAGRNTTISMLWNDFFDNHCRDLKMSTVGRYKTLYKWQIEPYFGNRKVQSLTRPDIRDWVEYLLNEVPNHRNFKQKGIAPKTVRNALGLLRTMYTYAIDELELIDKNPCQRVKVRQKVTSSDNGKIISMNDPQQHKRTVKKKLYTETECLDLILVLLEEQQKDYAAQRHATLLLLILFTGLRTSEVMGLRWSDINLDKNTLRVERERIHVPGEGIYLDSVKTTSSERVLSLPSFISDLLKNLKKTQSNHRKLMGRSYTPSGYVAIMEDGKPQRPRATYEWFKYFLKRYGFRDCTVHDLRHTHAAMLSRLGVQIIDVSQRLGHSNTRVTQEVYEYLFHNIDDQISNELDDYVRRKAGL